MSSTVKSSKSGPVTRNRVLNTCARRSAPCILVGVENGPENRSASLNDSLCGIRNRETYEQTMHFDNAGGFGPGLRRMGRAVVG